MVFFFLKSPASREMKPPRVEASPLRSAAISSGEASYGGPAGTEGGASCASISSMSS